MGSGMNKEDEKTVKSISLNEQEETIEIQKVNEQLDSSAKEPQGEVGLPAILNDEQKKGEQQKDSNEKTVSEKNNYTEKTSALILNSDLENQTKILDKTAIKVIKQSEEEQKTNITTIMIRNEGKDLFDYTKITKDPKDHQFDYTKTTKDPKEQFDDTKTTKNHKYHQFDYTTTTKDPKDHQELTNSSPQLSKSSVNVTQLKPEDYETKSQAIQKVRLSSNHITIQKNNFPNILFYADEMKSNFGSSYYLSELLERKGKYNKLEMDHSYIQWIFPNKYKSMFNYESQPLSDEEIDIFIRNIDLSQKLIECYEMMLDFYGMKLIDKLTGQLSRSDKPFPNDYKTRYREAVCGHNCLRIRRILTSLNNLGFRRYAIQLVQFLKREIFQGGKPLEGREWDFDYDWKQYGVCTEKKEIEELEKQTFQTMEQLERINIMLILEDDKYNKTQKQQEEDDFGFKKQ